jgi:hypothetical protein
MDETPERPTPHRARWAMLGAGTCLLIGIVALAGFQWLRPSTARPSAAPPAVARVATSSAPPAPTTVTPPPVPLARAVAIPHDYVAPAVPTSFTFSGSGFTIKARVCAMPAVFPLDPPGEQHHTVCWVRHGFGVKPGSRTATSYVLGHSWAPDPREVLNQISERATRAVLRTPARELDGVPVHPVRSLIGARLELRTQQGRLVYAVRSAYGVDKSKLGLIRSAVDQRIRNRVVLITCAELHGVDYDYNIVLDARLVSSRSAKS